MPFNVPQKTVSEPVTAYKTKKRSPVYKASLGGVAGGARTHDIQNHNLTL